MIVLETLLIKTANMNFGQLLYSLPNDKKKLARQIEKVNNKINKAKTSLVFNKMCIQENLLPTYTNINTHDPAAREEQFTVEYRQQLITR